jgi:carboxyl-terminal processing protease
VQDWDRGLILGVRSFGKGLVQTQKEFTDGSAMRLVISQYYTPSGRCIQKPFDMSSKEYEKELLDRFESGEIYDESKIDLPDSLMFKTNAGRPVYGGGGIMPDVFVPRDTTYDSDYLADLIAHNAFREYSFRFGDSHGDLEKQFPDAKSFVSQFKITDEIMQDFIAYAEEKGATFVEKDFNISKFDIEIYLKSFIGRRYFNDDGFYPVYDQSDNVLQKALKMMPEARELMKKGKFTLKD